MSATLETLYADAAKDHLQPLWIDTASYVPRRPSPKVMAAHWPGERVLELLRTAGETVSPELADRRVLVCNNPALPPFSPTTQTLYACVQLLQPGEQASMHRHTQNAFRFVLSGDGSQTVLNGQPFPMNRGDLIMTPAWTWHGHRNPSGNEVIWLDGLDSGILRLFDATFFELPGPADETPPGAACTAEGWDPHWRYEWETMRTRLEHARTSAMDPSLGYRVRYLHPVTGTDPLPTVAAYLNLLPSGFRGDIYRSSDSVIYVVASGRGRTVHGEGDAVIGWKENDIFTVPTWEGYRHEAEEDAVLFCFSDRGAQERLGCWREQRG